MPATEASLGSGNTPTNDTWIIGMAVKLPSFPDDEMILIVGRDWGNFNLRLSDTGQIAAGAGYSTILGQTTDPVLTIDNWHYIEVKVVVHASLLVITANQGPEEPQDGTPVGG